MSFFFFFVKTSWLNWRVVWKKYSLGVRGGGGGVICADCCGGSTWELISRSLEHQWLVIDQTFIAFNIAHQPLENYCLPFSVAVAAALPSPRLYIESDVLLSLVCCRGCCVRGCSGFRNFCTYAKMACCISFFLMKSYFCETLAC